MPSPARVLKNLLSPLRRPAYQLERQLYAAGVYSLEKLTLPHFLGLGAPQAGTTWLHVNLLQHPDVCLPEKKETHYFTQEFHRWSLKYYASLFADGSSRVRGEITPGYNLLKRDRIQYIRKILPDARLILIIRNPVDRAWSSWRRAATREAEKIGLTFDEIEDDQAHRYFQRHKSAEWGSGFDYEPGLAHEDYCATIDRWTEIFSAEQLLVCFFDEISNDPQGLMQKVCRHIGASTDIDWNAMPLRKVVNKNPAHAIPDRFRKYLREQYLSEIERLHKRYGEAVASWR